MLGSPLILLLFVLQQHSTLGQVRHPPSGNGACKEQCRQGEYDKASPEKLCRDKDLILCPFIGDCYRAERHRLAKSEMYYEPKRACKRLCSERTAPVRSSGAVGVF